MAAQKTVLVVEDSEIDLPLKLAYARLAGVVVDERVDRVVGDLRLGGGQSVALELLLAEVVFRNVELLLAGVAGKLDDRSRPRAPPRSPRRYRA